MNKTAFAAAMAVLSAVAAGQTGPATQTATEDSLPPGAVARLGTERLRLVGTQFSFVLSHDGGRVYGLDGRGLAIWRATDGKLLGRVDESGIGSRILAVSRDQTRMVVLGQNGAAHLRDIASPPASPAGQQMPQTRPTALVRADGKPLSGRARVVAAAFDGEAKWVTVVAADGIARCDAQTGREISGSKLAPGARAPNLAAVSADGTVVVFPDAVAKGKDPQTGQTYLLRVLVDGKEAAALGENPAQYVAFGVSADGSIVAAGDNQGRLEVWDRKTGRSWRRQALPKGRINALAVLPDGKAVWTITQDGRLRAWSADKDSPHLDLPVLKPGQSSAMAISGDGSVLAVYRGWSISLLDARSGRVLADPPGHRMHINAVCFRPDGRQLASGSHDGEVRLWSVPSGEAAAVLPAHQAGPVCLAFRPDGQVLASGGGMDHAIRLWDAAADNPIAEANDPKRWPAGLMFLDGGAPAAVCNEGSVLFLDPNAMVLHEMSLGQRPTAFALSPCRTVLATSQWLQSGRSDPQPILLWDLPRRKLLTALPTRSKGRLALAFSPCGQFLASAEIYDHEQRVNPRGVRTATSIRVTLYEIATGGEVLSFDTDWARTIAWSHDGRMIATGSEQCGDVHVYSAVTGRRLHEFLGHSARVESVAFSPDDRHLASGSFDTTVLLWDLSLARRSAQTHPALTRPADDMDLSAAWEALAKADAAPGARAMWAFVRAGRQGMEFLADRVRPYETRVADRLDDLIRRLDSSRYAERQQATRELESLAGEVAIPWKSLLDRVQTEEAKARLTRLSEQTPSRFLGDGEALRTVRVIGICRQMGGPPAVEILTRLSQGPPALRPTQEALIALKTLRPPASRPSGP